MTHDNYGLDPDQPTRDPAVRSAVGGQVPPAAEFIADAHRAASAVALLRDTRTIRARAAALLARARRGESAWFTVGGEDALEDAARAVIERTRERHPSGAIPLHSHWRHLDAGGVARLPALDALLGGGISPRERARALIDLALVGVLLGPGAGARWHYVEPSTHLRLEGAEGLAVASFHAFASGLFSSDPARPLQADAAGLRALVTDRLADALQLGPINALPSLAARATLLRRLGEAMAAQPEVFGEDGRPGGLFDALIGSGGPEAAPTAEIGAHDILALLLDSLSRIGPAAHPIEGSAADGGDPALALGDCWRHRAVQGPGLTQGWMPLHLRAQWLSYSLVEPFESAGVRVHGLDTLTGLPGQRNGGWLIDTCVLRPRDPAGLARRWRAGDEFIVEWRALTVALLDELAPRVRRRLGRGAEQLPLACILEGGARAAGRALAQRLRQGAPPLLIEEDDAFF